MSTIIEVKRVLAVGDRVRTTKPDADGRLFEGVVEIVGSVVATVKIGARSDCFTPGEIICIRIAGEPAPAAPTSCAECGVCWRFMAEETHRAGRALCSSCAQKFDDAAKDRSADRLERDVAREQAARLLAEPKPVVETQRVLNALTAISGLAQLALAANNDFNAPETRDQLRRILDAVDGFEKELRAIEKSGRRA